MAKLKLQRVVNHRVNGKSLSTKGIWKIENTLITIRKDHRRGEWYLSVAPFSLNLSKATSFWLQQAGLTNATFLTRREALEAISIEARLNPLPAYVKPIPIKVT